MHTRIISFWAEAEPEMITWVIYNNYSLIYYYVFQEGETCYVEKAPESEGDVISEEAWFQI